MPLGCLRMHVHSERFSLRCGVVLKGEHLCLRKEKGAYFLELSLQTRNAKPESSTLFAGHARERKHSL